MVKNWLTTGLSKSNATPDSSDTQSINSSFSQWTTTSTIRSDLSNLSLDPDLALSLHPLPDQTGLIAKITPPQAPSKPIDHVPCDIVLVIDVSGSMGTNAPVPSNPGEEAENHGLSVLDLVKHAARTILSTMNESDRLGIVTFAAQITVLQKLTPMTASAKKEVETKIESMRPLDATNLWHGILEAIKLFDEAGEKNSGRVPAMMILTDGMPNHMCPIQGYIPKIRGMERLPASIHTFGFGYSLRSGLLKSLAEIGNGNYAFIPDAGMIGTVFVHAVANLQSTYATDATLMLEFPQNLDLVETTGASVEKQQSLPVPGGPNEPKQLRISLGNIQYGQSRDIFLEVKNSKASKAAKAADIGGLTITAKVEYSRMTDAVYSKIIGPQPFNTATTMSEQEMAYHVSRSRICKLLSDIFPIQPDGEHNTRNLVSASELPSLKDFISKIPAQKFPTDPKNQSLLEDLSGPEPQGQIKLALSKIEFYNKWGKHYLPSLLNAHTRQVCNTFKDPGPLQYGIDSPLFISCRDRLDAAFDALPPPKPSNKHMATSRGAISMSHYNSSRGVCFTASTFVQLANGTNVFISTLKRNALIQTPNGPRHVAAVLKTPVVNEIMCRVNDLVITPWHPISLDGGKSWVFPAEGASSPVRYTGSIYSILLQPDSNPDSHSITVAGNILGVTLGHGLLSGTDTRAHTFFGNYTKVKTSLFRIGMNKNGIAMGAGVVRDPKTGLVDGFKSGRKAFIVGKQSRTRHGKSIRGRLRSMRAGFTA